MTSKLKIIGAGAIPVEDVENAYLFQKKKYIMFGEKLNGYYMKIKFKGKFLPISIYISDDYHDAMNELKKVI